MNNSSLVVIDMQKFFFEENSDVDQKQLASNCSEIISLSRSEGLPVIHVTTIYRSDQTDWPQAWRSDNSWCANLVKGNDLAHVVNGINSETQDFFLEKKRFSSFYNTNLDDLLRSLNCNHIYIIGYSADVCLRFTSVDAYNRGYGVTLIYEGIESFRETKDESVHYLDWLIDAKCITIDEFKKIVSISG